HSAQARSNPQPVSPQPRQTSTRTAQAPRQTKLALCLPHLPESSGRPPAAKFLRRRRTASPPPDQLEAVAPGRLGARRRGWGRDVRAARWRHRGGYISEYRHRPSAPVTEPPPRTQQPPPRAPSLPDAPSPPPAFSRSRLPQAVSTEEKESYRMSAIQNLHSFDPFADASKGDDLLPAGTEDYIHIRIQQRNGRKTLTTVQGIADDYDKKKLVKAFKK
uniref:SUI1 domain-containing protein n=1 Tax=Urocitellus parryii TaxID=9999 RepID=A0A8D2HE85_UROPR